jgi:O-antigen ligase
VLLGLVALNNGTRLEYASVGADMVYHDEASEVGKSTRSRQISFLAYGMVGAMLLVRGAQKDKRPYWPVLIPVVILVGYIFLSTLWSSDSGTTLRRAIVVGCITLGGLGIGKSWRQTDLMNAILCCSTSFLLISIAAEVYYGTFLRGSGIGDYRFSGVFHPARQAFGCGMLILACSSLYQLKGQQRYLVLAAIVCVFLLLTKARTGTAALMVAGLWLWWDYVGIRTVVILSPLAGLALGLALLGMGTSTDDIDLLNVTRMGRTEELSDPTTLTGRLPIWSQALSDFSHQPIQGYGYGAFWLPRRVLHFEKLTGWAFSHAHCMYIESLVNLGILGFSIGLAAVLATLHRALQLRRSAAAYGGRLVVSIMIFAGLAGLTESAFVADGYEVMVAVLCVGYTAFQGTLIPSQEQPRERERP